MKFHLIYLLVLFHVTSMLEAQPGGSHCCQTDLCPIDCVRCDGKPTCYDLSDELGCSNDKDRQLLAYEKPPVFVPFILNILKSRLRQEKMDLYNRNPNHVCFTSRETTTPLPVWLQLLRNLKGTLDAKPPTTTAASTTEMPVWKMLLFKLQGRSIPPEASPETTTVKTTTPPPSTTTTQATTTTLGPTTTSVPEIPTLSFDDEYAPLTTPTTTTTDAPISSTVTTTSLDTQSNTSVVSQTPEPDTVTIASDLPTPEQHQNVTIEVSQATESNITSADIESNVKSSQIIESNITVSTKPESSDNASTILPTQDTKLDTTVTSTFIKPEELSQVIIKAVTEFNTTVTLETLKSDEIFGASTTQATKTFSTLTSPTTKSDDISTRLTAQAREDVTHSSEISPTVTDATNATTESQTTDESKTLSMPTTTTQRTMGIPVSFGLDNAFFSSKQDITKPPSVSEVTTSMPSDSAGVSSSVPSIIETNFLSPLNATLIEKMIAEINSSISKMLLDRSATDSPNITTDLPTNQQQNESSNISTESSINDGKPVEKTTLALENIADGTTQHTSTGDLMVNDLSTTTGRPTDTSSNNEKRISDISGQNQISLNTSESRTSLVYITSETIVNSTNISEEETFGNATNSNNTQELDATNSIFVHSTNSTRNNTEESHASGKNNKHESNVIDNKNKFESKVTSNTSTCDINVTSSNNNIFEPVIENTTVQESDVNTNITDNEISGQREANGTHNITFEHAHNATKVSNQSETQSVDINIDVSNTSVSKYSVDEMTSNVNNGDNGNVYNTNKSGEAMNVAIVSTNNNEKSSNNKVSFEHDFMSPENEIRLILGKLHSMIEEQTNFSSLPILREFHIKNVKNSLEEKVNVNTPRTTVPKAPPSTIPTATGIIDELVYNVTEEPITMPITTNPTFTMDNLFGFTVAPPNSQNPYNASPQPASWGVLFGGDSGMPQSEGNQKASSNPRQSNEQLNNINNPFINNIISPPSTITPLKKETVQNGQTHSSFDQNGYIESSNYITTPKPFAAEQSTSSSLKKYQSATEINQIPFSNSMTTPKPSTQMPIYHNSADSNLDSRDQANSIQANPTTRNPFKAVDNTNGAVNYNANAGLPVERISSWWHQVYTTVPSDMFTSPTDIFTAPTTTYSPPFNEAEQCYEIQDHTGFCQTRSGHFSNPTDCRTFYVCMWGYLHRCSCPPNTMFDDKIQVCNWDSLVTCTK